MVNFVRGVLIISVGLKEDFKELLGFEQDHAGRVENRVYVDSPENPDKQGTSADHECQCILDAEQVFQSIEYLVVKLRETTGAS